jgi:hypothetical protein
MKRNLIILLSALIIFGCSCQPKVKKTILAKINNYEITKEEFEQEFKSSPYSRADTLGSRKEFLQNLINRKLILQDAEAGGLAKEPGFLKMIERFWEQSLLKLALDQKTKEIAGAAFVSDKTVEEAYQNMRRDGKTDKTYDQMYNQIKWEITKLKETQMLNNWMSGLRNKAEIKVNESLLK